MNDPATVPTRRPAVPRSLPRASPQRKQRGIAIFAQDPGVVELVTAKAGPVPPERAVAQDADGPVAQRQAALGKRRRDRQQAGHRMLHSVRVDEALAEHHVAPAFSVDHRTAARSGAQPAEKPPATPRAGPA